MIFYRKSGNAEQNTRSDTETENSNIEAEVSNTESVTESNIESDLEIRLKGRRRYSPAGPVSPFLNNPLKARSAERPYRYDTGAAAQMAERASPASSMKTVLRAISAMESMPTSLLFCVTGSRRT